MNDEEKKAPAAWDANGNPACPYCGKQEFIATELSEQSVTVQIKEGAKVVCDIGGEVKYELECDQCDGFIEVGEKEYAYFWPDDD